MGLCKRDLLGAEVRILALFTETLGAALEARLAKQAQAQSATPIVIATGTPLNPQRASIVSHALPQFYDLLGGEVRTDRIFRSDLQSLMNALGHNNLPQGMTGAADDLLEDYTKECLHYMLDCPVRRYGQERRFESLPDGVAFARNSTNLYFDAKAYRGSFHPSADDIKRFAAYISDFNSRYATIIGKIWRFLVVSGSFSTDRDAILERTFDLEAACNTHITFITASDLATSVNVVKDSGAKRSAINWKRVFSPGVFDLRRLKAEILRITKDRIIT